MKLTDIQKKQIEEELVASMDRLRNIKRDRVTREFFSIGAN